MKGLIERSVFVAHRGSPIRAPSTAWIVSDIEARPGRYRSHRERTGNRPNSYDPSCLAALWVARVGRGSDRTEVRGGERIGSSRVAPMVAVLCTRILLRPSTE
jgi:hypothetical protein